MNLETDPPSEWIHKIKSKSGFLEFMICSFLYDRDTTSSTFGKWSTCGTYSRHFVSCVMANGQGEFFVKLNRSCPSYWYFHNFHLFFLSTGQYWRHLLGYQWSNDSDEGISVQPSLPRGVDVNISSPPQFAYLPSQLSHESPQPGPSGLSTSASWNRVSPETVSQSSEDAESEPLAVARWSRADVLLLISCYAERRERFKDINTN